MPKSEIGWTDDTLNFYTWHCTKVSPGCAHCYAEARFNQYRKNASFSGHGEGTFSGTPIWRPNAEKELAATPGGTVVFVNSHSDTYHEKVAIGSVFKIHKLAVQRPDVIFLVLTKRPEHLERLHNQHITGGLPFPENLWVGVSVETNAYMGRIDVLHRIPAKHKFISFEPLLEPIQPESFLRQMPGIDWAIVGGESGDVRRKFDKEWAWDIRQMCKAMNIAFFFKQGSSAFAGSDRLLKGETYDELPPAMQAFKQRFVKPIQATLL